MIPKVIHYCWFGGRPLPELAKRCINSWKKYCPDYEIKEWNESNYDLDTCNYVRQAYEAGKWAFVSDYARFDILYKYGGLYFDTDVELIKPIDYLVEKGAFMGCEPSSIKSAISVAPGLGLAAEPGCEIYKEILNDYKHIDFFKENEFGNYVTVVERVSGILKNHGLKKINDIQFVAGVFVYPPRYFCPLDYVTGKLNITDDAYSVHWYTASWASNLDKKITKIRQIFADKGKVGYYLERILTLPLRVLNKVKKVGIVKSIKLFMSRNKYGGVKQNNHAFMFWRFQGTGGIIA